MDLRANRPTLKEKGLYFVGIDVIGAYLYRNQRNQPHLCPRDYGRNRLDITGDYLRSLAALKCS